MECCSELLANPQETVAFSLTRIPPPQDATCPWRSWCAASHWFVNRVVSSIKWESAVLSNNGSFLFFSHLQCRRTMNWNITKEAQNKKKKKNLRKQGNSRVEIPRFKSANLGLRWTRPPSHLSQPTTQTKGMTQLLINKWRF